MAVFPDRIVLKTSGDSEADIISAIEQGGAEEILKGELVLGVTPGSVRLYTIDDGGNVVQFGGSDSTLLGSLEDVDLAGLQDGQFIQWDEALQRWKPVNLDIQSADGVSEATITAVAGWNTQTTVAAFTESDGLVTGSGYVMGTSGGSVILGKSLGSGRAAGVSVAAPGTNGVDVRSPSGSLAVYDSYNTSSADVRLYNSDWTNYAGFAASQSLGQNLVWTLPTALGTAGNVLSTDGNGDLYWSTGPAPDLSNALLGSLGDVELSNLSDGDTITWDSNASKWVNVDSFNQKLSGLDDITASERYVNFEEYTVLQLDSATGDSSIRLGHDTYGLGDGNYNVSLDMQTNDSRAVSLGASELHGGISGIRTNNVFGIYNTSGPGVLELGRVDGKWHDSSATYNTVSLATDPATESYSLTLPSASGLNGQVLGTDDTGALGWYDTYPATGSGIVEYVFDFSSGSLIISGPGIGSTQPENLVLYSGLEYRFRPAQNNALLVRRTDGYTYIEDQMTGVGVAGGTLAWVPAQDTPQESLLLVGRSGSSLTEIFDIPLVVYSEVTPLGKNVISDLADVDTESTPPGFNQALLWNGSAWTPSPVYSEVGSVYIQGALWNTFVPTEPEVINPGSFFDDLSAATNSISFYKSDLNSFDYSSVFDSIIASGDSAWINVTRFYADGRSDSSGLVLLDSLSIASSNVYTLAWTKTRIEDTTPSSIALSIFEYRPLVIPVDSVNGQLGDVVLDVQDINDVFVEEATDLDVGFPYSKGSAGLVGQLQVDFEVSGDGRNYSLVLNNLDAARVNRRTLAAKQNNAYLRKSTDSVWVAVQSSPDVSTAGVYTYSGISAEAENIVLTSLAGELIYIKFEENPTEGYTLEADSILRFDYRDSFWKPSIPEITAGVSSVNGQAGDVLLALQDLTNVSDAIPQNDEFLAWNGTAWAPKVLEATASIVWDIGSAGSSAYTFTGPGFPVTTQNPDLYVIRGQQYTFRKASAEHPFELRDSQGNPYTDGLTGTTPLAAGDLVWVVPMDSPDLLTYNCTAHPVMFGQIFVNNSTSTLDLDDLADVDTTTTPPANGQVLAWNGTDWVPVDQTGGGGSGGVTSIIAGSGISVDQATGDVTIAATGSGGGGGGSSAARLVETQAAASGVATFVGIGHSGTLVDVTSSLDAWIVFYDSAASRTADSTRAYSTDPSTSSGVLAEFYITAAGTVLATPGTTYFNNDTSVTEAVYVAVRDQAGASADSVVTVTAYGNQTITSISGGTFGSGT